jgi:hypothetical protein
MRKIDYASDKRFFRRELELLGDPLDLRVEQYLHVLENRYTEEADDACRQYAATLTWPPLPDPVRLEVCLRLACAEWYCSTFGDETDLDDLDGQQFLESLLVEYWKDVGRESWLVEWVANGALNRHPPGY